MSEDLVIRRERPDQPEVAALLASLDAYLATLYEPEANHILGLPELLADEVTFLVARRGGAAVGTGAVRRRAGDAQTGGAAYGEIKRMFVAPAERGRRLGERLLASLEASLREAGIRQALLETGAAQSAAVHLYERCGYRRRPAFGGYPDNGLSLFLAKTL